MQTDIDWMNERLDRHPAVEIRYSQGSWQVWLICRVPRTQLANGTGPTFSDAYSEARELFTYLYEKARHEEASAR